MIKNSSKGAYILRDCIQVIVLSIYAFLFFGEFTFENGLFIIADELFSISFPSELNLFYGTASLFLALIIISRLMFPWNSFILFISCLFLFFCSFCLLYLGFSGIYLVVMFVLQNIILISYLGSFMSKIRKKASFYYSQAQVA